MNDAHAPEEDLVVRVAKVQDLFPPLIKNALGEGFNVIGWVMLWRPVEAYFFDPLPLHTSSVAHRFLSSLSIEIRVQPPRADTLSA